MEECSQFRHLRSYEALPDLPARPTTQRVDDDNLDVRIVSLQHGGDPSRRSRRTHAVNEGVDLSLRLTPDPLAQRVVTRDAVMVVELVGPVSVRLLAQLTGGLDHVQDEFLGGATSLTSDERELGTQRRHLIQLLLAERIGGDDLETIAFDGADQRKRCPGTATCVLDDGVSGLQSTVLLRPRNHGVCHSILDAAGGVLPLEFHEDVRTFGWNDLAKSNHRCVSDSVENVRGLISCAGWFSRLAQPTMHGSAPASGCLRVHILG